VDKYAYQVQGLQVMVNLSRRQALTQSSAPSRRLRVLVMPEWYPWPDRPINGTFCQEQARAIALAHDVRVITWRAEEHMGKLFSVHRSDQDGIPTYRIRFRSSAVPRLGSLFKMLGVLSVVARLRLSDAWIPDIVHAHVFGAGLPAAVVAAMSRAPVVITEHASTIALDLLNQRERAVARRAFKYADVICPVSDDLGRHLAGLAGRTPVVSVPNAVDERLFSLRSEAESQSSPERSEIDLLTVGSLLEIKGHRHLIQALAELHALGITARLELVGDGPLLGELQRQARELGVDRHVKFHGALSRAHIAKMMGVADIFVLPSLWETQGCALIEAMTCGCPSVATSVGGVPEVLDPRAGVLVEPGSSKALVGGMTEMLRRMVDYRPHEIRTMAVNRYGYAAVSRQWSVVYRSVLSKRTPLPMS
jgi:glycosyltransferase involved in cell wall biosynthesis